jgi:hypothetical protein
VPIDDETTMVYNWIYTGKSMPLSDEDRLERAIGNGNGPRYAVGACQAYLDGELSGVFPDGITSFSMIQAASDAATRPAGTARAFSSQAIASSVCDCSHAFERPSEAQLMAVGISDMEEALAPFRIAWRCLDPVAGSTRNPLS